MKSSDLSELLTNVSKSYIQFHENLQPHLNQLSKQFQEVGRRLQNLAMQIDFDKLERIVDDIHSVVFKRTEEMARQNIFLNTDILDGMTFSEVESKFNSSWILNWMEDNLEQKLTVLSADHNCFGETAILLKQSYSAFLKEDYAIAFIAIYPVIDALVSHWYSSENGYININDGEILSLYGKEKKKLKETHLSFRESINTQEGFAMELLFVSHALDAYSLIYSKHGNADFKRHHTMHGSLKYTQTNKVDYIKLFYLLYALYQLNGVTKSSYLALGITKSENPES